MARVSIIMGIYNCAETLHTAIESILGQTYTDWKLIMCDDGSKDHTYNVAKGYQKRHPEKITLIQNEKNMGLNYTLNRCLEFADSEYVARMDGDDISLPTRLEKEVQFLDEHPEYAIVSCPMIYFNEQGDFMTGKGNGEVIINSIARTTPHCHAPCMVRKEAYDAVNGYTVAKKRLRMEDWDLWIRMYAKGFRGFNLQEPLYKMFDGRDAYKRRAFKFRVNEARMSAFATKELHLSPTNYVYCLRPFLVWMLPSPVYNYLHKRKTRG